MRNGGNEVVKIIISVPILLRPNNRKRILLGRYWICEKSNYWCHLNKPIEIIDNPYNGYCLKCNDLINGEFSGKKSKCHSHLVIMIISNIIGLSMKLDGMKVFN